MGHTKTLKESQSQRETEKRKRETRQPARERERGKKWTCWHDHAVHGRDDDPGWGAQALGDPQGGGSAAGRGTGLRALGEGEGGLTLSSSSGRSPPSLMPRFMATKRSRPGLSRTLGL